jgi:hypothetical protein
MCSTNKGQFMHSWDKMFICIRAKHTELLDTRLERQFWKCFIAAWLSSACASGPSPPAKRTRAKAGAALPDRRLPAGRGGARGVDVLVGLHVRERVIETGNGAANELFVEHLVCELGRGRESENVVWDCGQYGEWGIWEWRSESENGTAGVKSEKWKVRKIWLEKIWEKIW